MKMKKVIDNASFSGYRTPIGLIETQVDKTTELKVLLYGKLYHKLWRNIIFLS